MVSIYDKSTYFYFMIFFIEMNKLRAKRKGGKIDVIARR